METPKIPTTNSPTTMNLTQLSSVSTKGYIFEPVNNDIDNRIDIRYRVEEQKNYNQIMDNLIEWNDNAEIVLFYNADTPNLHKARFIGRGSFGYCKIKKELSGPNPDGVGEIKLCDDNGNLLNNLILESTRDDIVICTDSKGKVTVLDDKHIDGCNDFNLVAKEVTKLLMTCGNDPIICNITTDTYITGDSIRGANPNVTLILDGGNLYRYHKLVGVPARIICKNGSFIDIASKCQKLHPETLGLASHAHFVKANEYCCFELTAGQNNIVVEFNPMDFVKSEDYNAVNSACSINLNNVLERIFRTIYNSNNQMQRMLIKMPETHYGTTNFYMDRPLHIPHNVTIDMSGAFIFVADSFQTDTSGCIISFDTNKVISNLATSIIKNFTMRFGTEILSNKKKPDNLRCVFDLTNFQGTLEDIKIYLNFNTEIIAFWQPFGTPFDSYSDRKIIRRCFVSECGSRNETPVAIFCEGDGNIIEQCILGYVAIICGHSYTIKGCLNDKYFLYDTTADFNGSYWEVSQFEILDSKVLFNNCRLTADNNHFRVLHDTNERYYLGPWMSIDTDSCRKRLVNMFKKFNLNIDRFNQIDNDYNDNKRFLGRGVSHRSTVEFQSSIRASQAGWGAAQPMASPLFNVGDGAKIIGIETLESPDGFAIQNAFMGGNMPQIAKVPVARATWLPLINGNFADVKSDIVVPDTISITAKSEAENNVNKNNTADEKQLGRDWNSDTFSNIRLRFLLDEQRRLYSREFNVRNTVVPKPGERIDVDIVADMAGQTYSNLKMELLFNRTTGNIRNNYKMRQHFYRVMDADIVSLTQVTDSDGLKHDNILAVHNDVFRIGRFQIIKSYFDKTEIENQTLKNHSNVKPIEPVEIEGYLPEPSEYALNDFFGNSYEPLALLPREYVNVATRIQWIGENNVRAFMTSLPQYGTWNDGDEVVLLTGVYRYFDGNWYEYITFRSGTLKPVDPGEGGITIDPIKPTEPILP